MSIQFYAVFPRNGGPHILAQIGTQTVHLHEADARETFKDLKHALDSIEVYLNAQEDAKKSYERRLQQTMKFPNAHP